MTPDPLTSPHAPAPGRPRGFDPETALKAALDLFWSRGYEAASLEDLTQAMGISRSSFYACFGSKRGALIAAVQLYCDERFAAFRAIGNSEADGASAARMMLQAIADPDGGPHGCFLVNCITELAPHDAEIGAIVRRQLARIESEIAASLRRAAPDRRDADDRARAILSLAAGAIMLRNAGIERPEIRAMLGSAETLIV